MSNRALPKNNSSKPSPNKEHCRLQRTRSEFSFELKPKPKLTCIPENSNKMFADVGSRKTQSVNVSKNAEGLEKSWSVIFIGSKTNLQARV